jgi:hypothetical protein
MTKASKAAVHYTDHAENHKERCALCVFFEAKDACRIVLGKIKPAGWCEEFQRASAYR